MQRQPAAFGRLCVETADSVFLVPFGWPAAFGRLCVETFTKLHGKQLGIASRLRAAVC